MPLWWQVLQPGQLLRQAGEVGGGIRRCRCGGRCVLSGGISTEMYLCNVWSCQQMLRIDGRVQARPLTAMRATRKVSRPPVPRHRRVLLARHHLRTPFAHLVSHARARPQPRSVRDSRPGARAAGKLRGRRRRLQPGHQAFAGLQGVCGGESFPRVHWVAVPEASRARRAIRHCGRPRPSTPRGSALTCAANAAHPSILAEIYLCHACSCRVCAVLERAIAVNGCRCACGVRQVPAAEPLPQRPADQIPGAPVVFLSFLSFLSSPMCHDPAAKRAAPDALSAGLGAVRADQESLPQGGPAVAPGQALGQGADIAPPPPPPPRPRPPPRKRKR
eukprot:COSAG01_NODE_2771_length_7101_cov_12.982148_13_plen_332_part_00